MGVEEPKKPKNAYWLFLEERRPILEKQVPEGEKKLTWVAKTVGTEWKALSDANKAKYETRAAADKEAYEKALEKFKAAGGVPATREKKKKKGGKDKKMVDETKPKKAKTAYFIFLDEMRPTLSKEVPAGEKAMPWIAKTGAARWRELTDDKRAPYEKLAAAEKVKHEKAVTDWKASKPAADESKASKPAEDAKKSSTKKRDAKSPKAKGKSDDVAAGDETAMKKSATPKKQAVSESSAKSTPKAKRGREPTAPDIDAKVLAEATKLGFDAALRNLAARPEMSAKPHAAMLKALQASGGLVNPAKRSLLEN
jgi:hypothetical protein